MKGKFKEKKTFKKGALGRWKKRKRKIVFTLFLTFTSHQYIIATITLSVPVCAVAAVARKVAQLGVKDKAKKKKGKYYLTFKIFSTLSFQKL